MNKKRVTIEIDMPSACNECGLAFHEGLNIYNCCLTKEDCEDPYNNRNRSCPLKLEEEN